MSVFRSDERTERNWLKLAALVVKSLVAGYVAALLPFWLAAWATASVPQPSWLVWILDVLSVAGVSSVEPLLFIGFSLIYLQGGRDVTPRAGFHHSRWAGVGGA